jgi:hypothetical protein
MTYDLLLLLIDLVTLLTAYYNDPMTLKACGPIDLVFS